MTVTSLRAQENVEDSRWETLSGVSRNTKDGMVRNIIRMLHTVTVSEKGKVSRQSDRSEGDSILRKDLKEMCALFRHLGKDSLLIACLAYQVGPYRLLGYGRMPKAR